MTIDQIMKLLDAGYTKEEIAALTSDPEPVPETVPPAPEPEVTTDPEPAPEPAEDQTGARLDALEKSIASLIKTIQVSNVNNKNIQTLPNDTTKIVDDALASIIRPTINKKEG